MSEVCGKMRAFRGGMGEVGGGMGQGDDAMNQCCGALRQGDGLLSEGGGGMSRFCAGMREREGALGARGGGFCEGAAWEWRAFRFTSGKPPADCLHCLFSYHRRLACSNCGGFCGRAYPLARLEWADAKKMGPRWGAGPCGGGFAQDRNRSRKTGGDATADER